ncbi:MAG: Lrp/AsnC ligand binding domain-containing protein [Nitrososphaerota archaeon]|nr:Lrp/AsnC ligand binding domain-containing protein [Candidatus Bathyarchaeota archaeon]MCX8162197.1 Lrp/AsnC ligand binding domain-containing protein [Candidatus Bathyarchaeota archaeon]MDW8062236.1 Lrp/AsnC ligand binding domain-containing protein [Nitrososphaerota archaeon]
MRLIKAIVLITARPGFFETLNLELSKAKGVKSVIATLGRWDFVVELEAEDLNNLEENVLKLAQTRGVKSTETLIAFPSV